MSWQIVFHTRDVDVGAESEDTIGNITYTPHQASWEGDHILVFEDYILSVVFTASESDGEYEFSYWSYSWNDEAGSVHSGIVYENQITTTSTVEGTEANGWNIIAYYKKKSEPVITGSIIRSRKDQTKILRATSDESKILRYADPS